MRKGWVTICSKDISDKYLLKFPEIFAEVYNKLAFKRGFSLDPENLEEFPTESILPEFNTVRNQYRDVIMKYTTKDGDQDSVYCMLGMENQSNIDPNMMLRIVSYDGAIYRDQHLKIEAKKLKRAYPVFNIILYYGNSSKYDGTVHLRDLFGVLPESALPFNSDYTAQIINVKNLTKATLDTLNGDAKIVFEVLNKFLNHETIKFNPKEYSDTTIKYPYAVNTMLRAHTGRDFKEAIEDLLEKGEPVSMVNIMGTYDEDIKERDQLISEQGQMLTKKDQVISEQGQMLTKKDQVISEKDQMLTKKDQRIEALEREIEALKRANLNPAHQMT